jgi:tRNA threonylcarbamoyladenosine biosynthesis protein TsaB
MKVLGIDTSTMTGGAALVSKNEGLIGEYVFNIRSTHSERVIPAIQAILSDAELNLSDIDAFSVVTGPGSFTGLRIGVATAKSFAYALNKSVIGVTTLEAFAWQYQFFDGLICPLIDARREEVYTQFFAGLEPVTEPWNKPIREVIEWCKLQNNKIIFVGDGAQINYDLIMDQGRDFAVIPPIDGVVLRASSVAGLGLRKLELGQIDQALTLQPFYLRRSEAEIKWMSKT